jgi:hypothetical protein
MPTYTKVPLSSAISGQQIQITGVSITQLTTIHTPAAGTLDEVWLYATNTTNANLEVVVTWAHTGTAAQMFATIPYKAGRSLLVDGKLLSGTANVVKAYVGVANGINIDGFVNRIT